MKLRNRIIISIIITILFITVAILVWATQTGKITIFGAGEGDLKPQVSYGQVVDFTGKITKQGDIYVVSENSLYPFDIYIINSEEVKNNLALLENKNIEVYGSLGGESNNELMLLWADGRVFLTEDQARSSYEFRLNKNAMDIIDGLSETQRQCILSTITMDDFIDYLINPDSSPLTDFQKNKIESCLK